MARKLSLWIAGVAAVALVSPPPARRAGFGATAEVGGDTPYLWLADVDEMGGMQGGQGQMKGMEGGPHPHGSPAGDAEMQKHESHHSGAPSSDAGPAAGDEHGEMERMMEPMMSAPPRREFYPSLMRLPDLPPEERTRIEHEATERLESGLGSIAESVEALGEASRREDVDVLCVLLGLHVWSALRYGLRWFS